MLSKNVNYKNCAPKMTLSHYTSSQNSVISVGYVDSSQMLFLNFILERQNVDSYKESF